MLHINITPYESLGSRGPKGNSVLHLVLRGRLRAGEEDVQNQTTFLLPYHALLQLPRAAAPTPPSAIHCNNSLDPISLFRIKSNNISKG
ncbi:hypothetical protein VTL71DRAFT_5154 [Oculimacula yallundae]|uniref:Uncharacterized protein n=1 Tax=Oculimacula yallundae TaxID=86028 RepID=A0ABR4C1Y2_9HELO